MTTMNIGIGQLSTNKVVRPSGCNNLAEMVVVAGSQESAPPTKDREWPFSKAVFVALICVGYVCAALSFYFMFNQIGQR
jgi:hypothetical protein